MIEDEFDEIEMEERLEALYQPGCYQEGEDLCLEILEEFDPDWAPARLYLLLFLAAQDVAEDALEMIDELESESLFEALLHLTFGAGTETEELVYQDIIISAEARGLKDKLESFFSLMEAPIGRRGISALMSAWD